MFATYRLQFGIETSYRQLHEGRIRTTTRRPAVRLLYVGIALVLRNLWVWLHYTLLALPRRGGRVILLERLRVGATTAALVAPAIRGGVRGRRRATPKGM